MRILWLSQHRPLPVQIERLRQRFGADVKVEVDTETFTDAENLVGRFRRGGYDDWVVVAPLSVVGRMCELAGELGLPKPLMARMDQLQSARRDEVDLVYRGRAFKFVGFRRVERLVLEFGESF